MPGGPGSGRKRSSAFSLLSPARLDSHFRFLLPLSLNGQLRTALLVIYAEDETGRFLKVFAAPNDGSGALYLIPEDATLIPIQLGDIQADYYQSNIESSGSTIVWTDPENDYLVTVDGFFSLEELTDMALNQVKERVPVPEN